MFVVTINNKASCKIYEIDKNNCFKEVYSISFPLNRIPESVCLFSASKTKLILAIGGMDQQIHLYAADTADFKFEYVDSLKGHENAITKLTAVVTSN